MAKRGTVKIGARVAAGMLSALLFALAFACPAAARTGDVIRVGGNRDYPPYEMPGKNGEPTGFTVDLLQAIADVMGMKVDIQLGEWAQRHDDLKEGRIDMTLGMSNSQDRERIFDFSTPYAVVQHAVFARRGALVVHSLEELRGKKVIVHRNGIMHERLKKLGFEKDLIFSETPAGTLLLLSSGEGDYAVVALLPGMFLIKENKLTNIVPVNNNVASFKFSFGVHEGDTELVARLNEGMAILKKTGQFQVIYDRWLGVLEPHRLSWEKVAQYAAIVLIPLFLLLTGTFVWSRTLQKKVAQRTEELAREVEQKNRALHELHLHQDRLIQADKLASLGILVSGVAHEINNPTGLILMNLPTVQEALEDGREILEEHYHNHGDFKFGGVPYSKMRDNLPEMVQQMHDGANKIRNIVDDLKDFARVERDLEREPFNLNEVVLAAMRLTNATIRSATRRFTFTPADDLPKASGSPQRIEQVVVNLIINACQALENRERGIHVSTHRGAGVVVLKVRDEGVGVPLEHLTHLTDPFFTTKREAAGTGLGLSVSSAIVTDHGGTLEFASVPGEGCTVTLTLPQIA